MSLRSHFFYALLVLAVAGVLAGCGTPGAPQAPSLRVPRPAQDLTATRKGDRVLLTWTPATQTTDGENLRNAGITLVCRGINDFPMAKCDEKVATLNDAQVEHWTKGTLAARHDYTDTLPEAMQKQSPFGFVSYAISDENPNGRSAGLSNQVQVALAPTLEPPSDITGSVTAEGVQLAWGEVQTPPVIENLHYAYRIYRRDATSDKKPELIAGEIPAGASVNTSFLDRNIEWEQHYDYRVSPVTVLQQPGKEAIEVEGADSPTVEVFAHDVFPPAVPAGVQAVFSGTGQKPFIDLTWAPNLESDLAGYNVYRHEEGAAAAKVNTDLVKTPAFRDANVEAGHQYFYSVTAVDQRGNESGRSEQANEKVPQAQ